MKKLTLLVVFYTFSLTYCFCQDSIEWPKFKWNTTFSNYLHNHLSTDLYLIKNTCSKSVFTVKFTISENGAVSSTVLSKNASKEFQSIVLPLVRGTHFNWVPMKIDGKSVESKPIIVKVTVNMNSGCPENIKDTFVDKTDESLIDLFVYGNSKEEFDLSTALILDDVNVKMIIEH